jgi:hypothetical protein
MVNRVLNPIQLNHGAVEALAHGHEILGELHGGIVGAWEMNSSKVGGFFLIAEIVAVPVRERFLVL